MMFYTANIVINGTPQTSNFYYADTTLYKFAAGDTVKLEGSCDDKKNATQTAEPAKSIFSIIKAL